MLRYFIFGLPVCGAAIFYFGQTDGYSRTVDRSPGEVSRALADLDLAGQPGAPGTDPSRSGGIRPVYRRSTTADSVVWKIMSGNQVAMTLIAHLEPIDGGKRTYVTASVERGDAPDDFVSPAFRSEGVTMGLFTMALEDELNDLTRVMTASAGDCRELLERFEESNLADPDMHSQKGLKDAMTDVAKTSMKMQAYQAEARRLGCDDYFGMGGDGDGPREAPESWDEESTNVESDWGA